jgi:dihydroflavonol-4-reductase
MATTKTKQRAPRKASTKSKTVKSRTTAIARRPLPKTLVTGGTGFLGTHLVRQLLDDGVKNLRVMATSVPAWLAEAGVEAIEGSITNASDVKRAVEGVGEIYHLAGRVSRDNDDAREMYAIHVDGTRYLCEAARAAGVKSIVMASTSGTIAVTAKGELIPDEDWPAPLEIISRWPYYASKFYQERTALENFDGRGHRLVIVNPSLLLGPGDERLSSTKVVLDFLAQKIRVTPTGGLSFVDVRDAATAFRAAMKQGKHGERYLLGSANWSFKQFLGRLERLTKVRAPNFSLPSKLAVTGAKFVGDLWRQWNLSPPVEPAEVEMAEHFWYLNSSKAEQELGFAPRDPSETLQDTVYYVRENFLGSAAFK